MFLSRGRSSDTHRSALLVIASALELDALVWHA